MATLIERYQLLAKAKEDTVLQSEILELCKRDPVFFCNHFGWVFEPRDGRGILPFNLYPYQEWFVYLVVEKIEAQKDFLIEKSRTMGVSWMMMMIFLWYWLFVPSSSFLVGSYTEEEVDKNLVDPEDTLFGKLRFMLGELPFWMVTPADYTDKHLSLKNERNGNSITGKAPTPNFGRGSRKKAIFFDELGFWQWGRPAYESASQTSKCRIMNSTPNGKYDIYGQEATNPNSKKLVFPKRRELVIAKGL